MFDPSFFELIVICIVALLVLGPDRLPGAIKTFGLWIGRLRRSFNNIKREIEQEVGADEIRRQLRNEAIMEKFNNTKSQITKSIDSVKSQAESIKNDLDIKKQLSGVTGEMDNDAGDDPESDDPIGKLATNDQTARILKPEIGKNTEKKDDLQENNIDTPAQKVPKYSDYKADAPEKSGKTVKPGKTVKSGKTAKSGKTVKPDKTEE